MGSWIFLVALLLHLSTAKALEPQYVLLVPAVVQSNSSNEACVQFLNINEPISVNITMEYNIDSYPLWKRTVEENSFSHCITFMVPPAVSNPLAFIVLSAQGSSVSFHERRSVAIRNISTTVFVQTDKSAYKPSQKVLFRVVALNPDFKPVNQMYPSIYIQDPKGNRIAQWLNQSAAFGILQLEFLTVQDANLGSYQIIVEHAPNRYTYHWFSLEEYVLPRYEATIQAPEKLSPFDEEFELSICAKYTYGQPVQGVAQLRVCRQHYYNPRCNQDSNRICETVSAQLGKNGCVSKIISTKVFRLYAGLGENRYFFLSLHVEGTVTENGTGIQISRSTYISIYQARKTIMFENIDSYYRRGLPYSGQIRLRDEDHKPLANGLIFLEFNGETVANYTTDINGTAQFSIETSNLFEPRYKLRAFYQSDQCTDYGWLDAYQPEVVYYIQRFFSRSGSFVKIEPVLEELPCGKQKSVTVHYILNKEQYKDIQTTSVNFYAILVTKGKIVDGGKQEVSIRAGQYSTFSVSLNITQNLAPRTRLLVYSVQPYGDIIADSISLEVEKCFRNKVSLQFSEKQALPASEITLHLSAEATSFCAVRAVDKSVLLLSPRIDLSPENVYNRMPYLDLFGYYHNGLNLDDGPKEPCIEMHNTFYNGLYYMPVNVTNDGNVHDIFQNMGIKVFTGSSLQKPVVCVSDFECKKISTDDHDPRVEKAFSSDAFANRVIETVRTNFPETWIWDMVTIDTTGKTNLLYTVPDTITEWIANAFCVENDAGFGISRPASLTAFQPFFVEITLPYSAVRGEEIILKANIFNHLNSCIEVTVTLEDSQDFEVENLSTEKDFTRICADETKSYSWRIRLQKLGTVNFTVTAEAKAGELTEGRRDTVIKPLLVEPEGVKKEVTQSSLICAKGTPVSEAVILNLPANLVEGSARASFTVLGDILGTAMRNFEYYLQMPYGCGEQNIAMYLSNFVILNYLNNTKQLTEEKKSRIIGHLNSGYQKQLFYQLTNGAFSTFGNANEGNLWLTALVYKAFARTKSHIYIYDNILNQALIWIASKQKADGCFEPVGGIYNNGLKQGKNYDILVTAHVTASLLESGISNSYPVVRNGLSCLDAALNGNLENIYENALMAYTYSLAGEAEKQKRLLDILMQSATRTGGLLYWEREKKPAAEIFPSFYPRASSAEIEIASYVLLAHLRQLNLSQEQLTEASQMAQWLTRQQNYYGGFSSTQDTPVALQALSEYGTLTFTKDAQNTVVISAGESFKQLFQVDSSVSILLQQTTLPSIPGNYSVEVKGSGCVYVQTFLRYNVILPEQASGFSLAVEIKNASCTGNFFPKMDVVLTVSYTGERNVSNMAIIDMKMLSGFVPVRSSLDQLQNEVARWEIRNDHVSIYLREVSAKEITLTITIEETHPVTNNKPAQIGIYDYYETDEYAMAEYNTPCQV
ncbi:ovostatin-like isoform X1 [Python bivittatus]|uniref:Ovostatin-like isoform X1 n=1 Tax=Python bivittatus TaxID=176946 RepID=A0A9F3QRM0_PYTBI|nr:ovostatin-like isoform X1 [Python bivittatus]XP_015743610.1 ovostatin-like isoform X1 [Python bivittatus]